MLTLTCTGYGYLDIHVNMYNIVNSIFSYKADLDMLWLTLGLAAILLMWMPVVVCQVDVGASKHACIQSYVHISSCIHEYIGYGPGPRAAT